VATSAISFVTREVIVGQKEDGHESTLTLAMSFAPAFVKSWCSSSFFAQILLRRRQVRK
jgi:hypothetical protein